MLDEIRSGAYAKKWIGENEAGRPWFDARRKKERSQPIEEVGAKLRAMIPFLDSVVVTPEGDVKSAAGRRRRRSPRRGRPAAPCEGQKAVRADHGGGPRAVTAPCLASPFWAGWRDSGTSSGPHATSLAGRRVPGDGTDVQFTPSAQSAWAASPTTGTSGDGTRASGGTAVPRFQDGRHCSTSPSPYVVAMARVPW